MHLNFFLNFIRPEKLVDIDQSETFTYKLTKSFISEAFIGKPYLPTALSLWAFDLGFRRYMCKRSYLLIIIICVHTYLLVG